MSEPTQIPMGSCAPPSGAATSAPAAPATVGRYHVLGEIGTGGMGVVYKAEQRHPIRRVVALKLVKPGHGSTEVVARFEAERQALALMDHPHVARVFDAGTTPDARPYFVMEYVPGEPITRFADANRLTIRERLALFAQACHAIAHAHTKGLIHRDVKAGNVLAFVHDGQPTVKVIDFGIAKALAGDRLTDLTYSTQRGQLVGTYESMSPEQAEGSLDIDTRTDVYSLGALLYELLAGSPPFDRTTLASASDAEVRRIIREHEPPRPGTRLTADPDRARELAALRQTRPAALARQLDGELGWIPLMAMRKERQRRYASPLALAEDIDNYLHGRPLVAGPESRAYRAAKFVQRNRAAVVAGAVVVLLGVAGTVLYVSGLRAEQRRTRDALTEAQRQKSEADRQREEARHQAAVAQAVAEFQSDMLGSADPQKLLGERVTVLEVAQAAIRDLDAGRLKDQPLLEASVRCTIGETFAELGRGAEAEAALRRALELRRGALPPGHADVAAVLEPLADVLRTRGRLAEAEPVAREAVDLRRRRHGASAEDDANLGRALSGLGLLLKEQARFDEGEAALREALGLLRTVPPQHQKYLPLVLNNLGSLLRSRGRAAEAERAFLESLEIKRRTLAPGHPSIANSLGTLAGLYLEQRRFTEAETILRDALDMRRRNLPEGHPIIAMNLSDIGLALQNQNKLAEAEPWLRDGLAMARASLPAAHPQIADALTNLGLLLERQGRRADAEAMFREGLKINREALPPGHPRIVNTLLCLSGMLRAAHRPAEAEPLLREVLEINRRAFPGDHPYVAIATFTVGMVLREQDRWSEAEPHFRESLAQYAKLYGPTDARACRSAFMLAAVLDETGRTDEAASLRREYRLGDPSTKPTTTPATSTAAR